MAAEEQRLSLAESIKQGIWIFREVMNDNEERASVEDAAVLNLCTLLDFALSKPEAHPIEDLRDALVVLHEQLLTDDNGQDVLKRVGWDLLKLLLPTIARGGDVHDLAMPLLNKISEVVSAKEVFIVVVEQLEAWDFSLDSHGYAAIALLQQLPKVLERIRPQRWSQFLLTLLSAIRTFVTEVELFISQEWTTPDENQVIKPAKQKNRDVSPGSATSATSNAIYAALVDVVATVGKLIAQQETPTTPVTLARAQSQVNYAAYLTVTIALDIFARVTLHLQLDEAVVVQQSRFAKRKPNRPDAPIAHQFVGKDAWNSSSFFETTQKLLHTFDLLRLSPMSLLLFASSGSLQDGEPDNSAASVTVGESIDKEDNEVPMVSLKGVASYICLAKHPIAAKMSVLPEVLNSTYLLASVIPAITTLLESGKVGSLRSLQLLEAIVTFVPVRSLQLASLEIASQDPRPPFIVLAEAIVSFLVSCPDGDVRGVAHGLLQQYLFCFEDLSLLFILQDILPRCPFPNAEAMLVQLVKDVIDRAWPNTESPLASRRLWDSLLPFIFNYNETSPTFLLDNFDSAMARINLYLFLLMREDPIKNQSGVFDSANDHRVHNEFITRLLNNGILPLRQHIDQLRTQTNRQPSSDTPIAPEDLNAHEDSARLLEYLVTDAERIRQERLKIRQTL